MAQEIITFENVHFFYPGETAAVLRGSSFRVCQGDRIALKGESGSGKTTLFRLILGFSRPAKGSILYHGESLNSDTIRQLRRESVWLPQDLNLGSGTVEEVMAVPFGFSANAGSLPEEKVIQNIFTQLGLEPSLFKNNFSELSTGQRQRIGIAICHLLDKPLLLLDEPTSALDSASKQKAIDLLFENPKRTIISTSHDPYWIEQCNKVIELK